MENNNKIEVILFSKYSLSDIRRKELVKWVGITIQPAISHQHDSAKKLFLRNLKDTPAIYLS
jgi:hypothetical protein